MLSHRHVLLLTTVARLGFALATLSVAMAGGQRASVAQESQGIVADVVGNYDIRPDEPAVDVRWDVDLENTGPSPLTDTEGEYAEGGEGLTSIDQHPDSVSIFVGGDRASFRAFGASGEALSVSSEEYFEGFSYATVHFGRSLAYGDQFAFSYSYSLTAGDDSYYTLRSHYVALSAYPAISPVDTFRSSVLRVSVPFVYSDDVLINGPSCKPAGRGAIVTFECHPADDEFGLYADIEAIDPTARVSSAETVSLGNRSVELTLQYLNGDESWGRRVRDLIVGAGPVLEELLGSPYPGPARLRVSEKGSQEISGYGGLASCRRAACDIAVPPNFDDLTLIHELTHAWTQSLNNRWLAEGAAEFISERAAEQMGLVPHDTYVPTKETPPFPLSEWRLTIDFITAPEEQQQREHLGYYWAAEFFRQLELKVGAEPLKRTIAALVSATDSSVNSRRFMDTLEDVGGARADDLFIDYIFPDKQVTQIQQRRAARDGLTAVSARATAQAPELAQDVLIPVREAVAAWLFGDALTVLDKVEPGLAAYLEIRERLVALQAAADHAGLAYPTPLRNATATWEFAPFLDKIDEAEAALEAYAEAERNISAPRGVVQRIGLFGKSPESRLQAAALAFASADFAGSMTESHAATAMLDDASGRAFVNVVIGLGVLAALAVLAVFMLRWALRDEPSAARA